MRDCGKLLLIKENGNRVGMIKLLERPEAIEIGEIQIEPSAQGRGLGSLILRDTIAQAHAQGKSVWLSTGLKNDRARRLYLRLGFREVDRSDTHRRFVFEPPG